MKLELPYSILLLYILLVPRGHVIRRPLEREFLLELLLTKTSCFNQAVRKHPVRKRARYVIVDDHPESTVTYGI